MVKKRVVAIIQARMGSKRLPGKSLADLAGKPMVWQILQRVKKAKEIDELVLATTEKAEDTPLIEIAKACKVSTFRGSENDLVGRYLKAAETFNADVVVRMCADNPVLQASEIDRIIRYHAKGESDFSSNTHNILENGYPDGLGAEVFDKSKLEEVARLATDPRNREHPHTYFYEHPDQFRIGTIKCPPEFRRPELKLDVNTAEELAFLRSLYDYCYPRNNDFTIMDIIEWYDTVYSRTKTASEA